MKRAAVLAILAAGGPAFGLPFSHELHLKLRPKCADCHAAASASTKREDNLLPRREACADCHADPSLRTTPSPTFLSRFDHAKHLRMGNLAPVLKAAIDSRQHLSPAGGGRRFLDTQNACAACHRGLEESKEVTHAAFPQMADCLVCHNRIDPPFSCEFCHAKGAALKPASHTADFIDRHNHRVQTLGRESCAVCHGRKFTCMGCH